MKVFMALLSFNIIFISLLTFVPFTKAQDIPNNKFGIHLATPQDEDIDRALDLINSNGGEWGYITLVIQENDRNVDKWQGIFDKLREKRLIPIIRLATQPEGASWRRPKSTDANSWVDFLNKLNWVVKNRYIILFNEPNHASEWGGEVDIATYAQVAEHFARQLRRSHIDYVIMPAGLDTAAPSRLPIYEDAGNFIKGLVERVGASDMNELFHGWSSHSYPNPAFAGPSNASGQGTVRSYRWEMQLLNKLSVKELPVFITETGWDAHKIGDDAVAANFQNAFQYVWLPDPLVKAVTPFILNYQTEPFLQFSWVRQGNGGVYPVYETVKNMKKVTGEPVQDEKGLFTFNLPKEIVQNSTYHFQFELKNTGQGIWEDGRGYEIAIEGLERTAYLISDLGRIKPNQDRVFDVYINTSSTSGDKVAKFTLLKKGKPVLQSENWEFSIVPLPSLSINASLFPKIQSSGDDFELQLFDEYEQLVFTYTGLRIISGEGRIDEVENIALGKKYRAVLLKPNYLPRQTFVTFAREGNEVAFDRMLPFDFNGDGASTFADVSGFFAKPSLIKNLLP